MADPTEPSNGIILWAALRQLQALRDALTWSLSGDFTFQGTGESRRLSDETADAWLSQQGLGDFLVRGAHRATAMIGATVEPYRWHLLGKDAWIAENEGQRTAQNTDDFGAERSGGGFLRTINFCITSAFVRLLGAWEQYELDVLKALFYYRP